ncbi:hypothetical protein GOFOIKOB_6542 [Methylobacterium tardum]|nr:hypothetical protein GOFOIKOB_6542 [Methylobacterium tardum]
MSQRIDPVLQDRLCDERLVRHVADHKLDAFRDGPVEARRQIVQDDDLLMAGIEQRQNHVAADVAGAARH